MQTLNRYLTRDFLVTFGITLAVFTGVMSLGVLKQAVDVAARGISFGLVLQVFGLNFPFMLTFTIPISLLTASLLVFGRMSFDGEITAMKACGISLWQIIAPILCIAIALALFCLAINTTIAPHCRWQYRAMIAKAGGIDPATLLEPGRFVRDFPGLLIYISSRDGNRINNVVVIQPGTNGAQQRISAEHGTIRTDQTNALMHINLYNVRNDARIKDGNKDDSVQRIIAAEYPYTIDLKQVLRKQNVTRKIGEMNYRELIHGAANIAEYFPGVEPEKLREQRMTMLIEASKRLALSIACFAFVLIGVPLGLKSKRKESSIGIAISFAVVFVFYLFLIIATNLKGHPAARPDLIIWIPVIAAQLLGFHLIRRAN